MSLQRRFIKNEELDDLLSTFMSVFGYKTAFLFKMLAVNVLITLSMEIGIRESSYFLNLVDDSSVRFFHFSNTGALYINSQSLVNLFMTFFATVLSVRVFLENNLKQRYLYFVSFCVLLSLLAQSASSYVQPNFQFSLSRLGFDLLYGMTIKYMVFSIYRKPILNTVHSSFKRTVRFRITQDFILSCFRFACLTLIGLRD